MTHRQLSEQQRDPTIGAISPESNSAQQVSFFEGAKMLKR